MHPEDRDGVWKALKDAMEGRSPCAAEFRILWPNGAVKWVAAEGQFTTSPAATRSGCWEWPWTSPNARTRGVIAAQGDRTQGSSGLAGVGSWHWEPDADTVVWSQELSRIAGRDPGLPAVSYEDHSKLYTRESWDRLSGVVETAFHTGTPYELDLE